MSQYQTPYTKTTIQRNTRYIWLPFILLSALFLSACISPAGMTNTSTAPVDGNPAAAPTDLVPLKVQLLPLLSFGPYFIAQEEGYFTEQGLSVEFVRFQRSSEAIPALIQGQLDVIGGTVSAGLLNAMARDAGIKMVADKGYIATDDCSHHSLSASTQILESGLLDDPTQLRGQRFAVNPTAVRGYFVDLVLKSYGLTYDDIEVVDLPDPALLDGFTTGAIGFVAISEPWITRLQQAGVADIWIPASDFIPDFPLGVVTFGPNLLEKNPEVGQRFINAYLKAVRQYNEGKTARNLEIIAQYTELEMELLQATCWPSMRDSGAINLERLMEFQQWSMEKGEIDAILTEEQLMDQRFVDAATAALQHAD